jgi:CheY-like chemotaxis protein
LTVLVVDDDRMVLDSTAAMLEDLGHGVSRAGSALEAISLLENGSFDLLLTDQVMPHISGAELIRLVRDRWPRLKLILASGYSEQEPVKGVVRLAKPYGQGQLDAALRDALGSDRTTERFKAP